MAYKARPYATFDALFGPRFFARLALVEADGLYVSTNPQSGQAIWCALVGPRLYLLLGILSRANGQRPGYKVSNFRFLPVSQAIPQFMRLIHSLGHICHRRHILTCTPYNEELRLTLTVPTEKE